MRFDSSNTAPAQPNCIFMNAKERVAHEGSRHGEPGRWLAALTRLLTADECCKGSCEQDRSRRIGQKSFVPCGILQAAASHYFRLASDSDVGYGRHFSVPAPAHLNKPLNSLQHPVVMRLLIATALALLVLNFVDEHYNDGTFSRAAARMIVQIRHSAGV